MAQLATQQDASPLVAALLRGGEAGLGEGRSPLSPSLGGLDLYSPVSVLMGNLTAVETHKQLVTEAASLEEMTSSPTTPGGAHFAAGDAGRQCPPTPLRPLRLERQDSLNNTKLLCATTQLRRVSQTSYNVLASGAPLPSEPGQPGYFAGNQAFDFLRVIGQSPTSEVWLVRSRSDGGLSAVKRSLAAFTNRADRQRYLREVQAAAALPEHPHVVRYFRAWQQERHFYVQQELCEGGSLAGVLRALPPGVRLPESDLWRLATEIADGLTHCHLHGVLHLDVKPANVFLDAGASAKLGDFGNALLCGKGWLSSEEGSGAYVAPEMLRSDGRDASPAADVYSLGAALFEAAAGAPPPAGAPAPLAIPARSERLHHLLRAMLAPDPEARPTALQVALYAAETRQGRPGVL